MPTWRELFIVQLFFFLIYLPFNCFKILIGIPEFVGNLASGELFRPYTEEELDEKRFFPVLKLFIFLFFFFFHFISFLLLTDFRRRLQMGLSKEEYAQKKEEFLRKQAELMNSAKAKRYRRWLKKNG